MTGFWVDEEQRVSKEFGELVVFGMIWHDMKLLEPQR